MAKLDLLLDIEGLLESYDGLKVKDSFMTDSFRACVETQVEKVNDKLNRLLTSKTKLSCRNVLTANFETMTKPDHWLKSKLFKVLPKNESLVLREKIEEMVELLKALMLRIKDVDPDYAGQFFGKLKNRYYKEHITDYELWKADLADFNMDVLSEYQAEITADMLILGVLKYDRPPSDDEMRKVDLEKLRKKLKHNKVLPSNFKEECAKIRRYTHWEGELFTIDNHRLRKYMYLNFGKLSHDQHIELYKYQVQMNQIHEDMRKLMALEQCAELGVAQTSELTSEAAMIYWHRLMDLGFVDENCKLKPGTSRQQAMYIAEPFSEALGLKTKWKDFEDFWGIRNLAQEKWACQQTGAMPARYQEIDHVFEH